MLNQGVSIPILGLGVWQTPPGAPTQRAVRHALQVGYRHIDTARYYRNEADVGAAVRESELSRDQVFVTTKLANEDHGYDAARRALDESLAALGLAYVDLYLIHWPVSGLRRESWRALEQLQADGKCRTIGVSNYTARHIEELTGYARVLPAVNQVEMHPFLAQGAVRATCRAHRIAIEAYSPLTRGQRLGDPRVVDVAQRVGRTPPQVLLRWAVQHGAVVLPKSVRRERIEENAKIFDFELAPEEMARLDALDQNLHLCWDPTNVP